MSTFATTPTRIRHRDWPASERIVFGEDDHGTGLVVTNRSLLRNGRRWIPITIVWRVEIARDVVAAHPRDGLRRHVESTPFRSTHG